MDVYSHLNKEIRSYKDASLSSYWGSGYGGRVMFVIVINTFCYLGIVFSEKKVQLSILKSLTCHPRVFMLCLVEIGQMVREKRILSVINVLLVLYRFGKGRGPSFKQT